MFIHSTRRSGCWHGRSKDGQQETETLFQFASKDHDLSRGPASSMCSDFGGPLQLLQLIVAVGDGTMSQICHQSRGLGLCSVTSALPWTSAAHHHGCSGWWLDWDHVGWQKSWSNIFMKNKEMKTEDVDDFLSHQSLSVNHLSCTIILAHRWRISLEIHLPGYSLWVWP